MKIGLKSSCEKSWRVLWFDHSLFQNLRASRGTGIQEIQNGIGSCTLASESLPGCRQNCFTEGRSWNWRQRQCSHYQEDNPFPWYPSFASLGKPGSSQSPVTTRQVRRDEANLRICKAASQGQWRSSDDALTNYSFAPYVSKLRTCPCHFIIQMLKV